MFLVLVGFTYLSWVGIGKKSSSVVWCLSVCCGVVF